jgi:predicted ATP-dependent serine protease
MTPAHVRGFIKHYPDKALIFVSQNTKSGQARGSLELQHDVDIVLKAENGVVQNVKNRFGGNGTMQVF